MKEFDRRTEDLRRNEREIAILKEKIKHICGLKPDQRQRDRIKEKLDDK